jgi:hypothetical protein
MQLILCFKIILTSLTKFPNKHLTIPTTNKDNITVTLTDIINGLIERHPDTDSHLIANWYLVEQLLPGCSIDLEPMNLPFEQWTDEETAEALRLRVECEYQVIDEIHIHGIEHPVTGQVHELREFYFDGFPSFTIPPGTMVFVNNYTTA